MSQLALISDYSVIDEPRILSFVEHARGRQPEAVAQTSVLRLDSRARLEHQNRSCPICNRVTVEPVELRNGRIGRNGRIVPGTGTLVGFSCNACGHEWPV